jgi:serine/threonine kinase PknH
MSHPNCRGALYTAQQSGYSGSGWVPVSDQVLRDRSPDSNGVTLYVDQTAVTFPSADVAREFLKASTAKWKGCAGQIVTVTEGNNQYRWVPGDLAGGASKIAQLQMQEGTGGWACQHALSTAGNAVIEVVACSDQINNQASQLADKMVTRTTR